MSTVYQYVSRVKQAIAQGDGQRLAATLELRIANIDRPLLTSLRNISEYDINGQSSNLDAPYSSFLCLYLKALQSLSNNQPLQAFDRVSELYSSFITIFQESEGIWLLPVLNTLTIGYRLLAFSADSSLSSSSLSTEKCEEAERTIKRCFTVTVSDRSPLAESKKWGGLIVINNLFKIYFHLNHLRLCQHLLAYVKTTGFPEVTQFPTQQLIPYRFFSGRFSMFQGNFKQALEELHDAFALCPSRFETNRRAILIYLIPCELWSGRSIPTKELMENYKLTGIYGEIVGAIRKGDLRTYNRVMEEKREFWIKKGLYLILEKLKYMIYRTLFKRVMLIRNTTKLQIADFGRALDWLGEKKDEEEIECILANLVYRGMIKGYLSHKLKTLVVSANDPFPKMGTK